VAERRKSSGKPGTKIHAMTDRTGLPLTTLTSAANVHDAHLLVPLLDSLASIRSRRGRRRTRPAKLHGDKAYNNQYTRAGLRRRRIAARLARPGIEPSDRLGRHRWASTDTTDSAAYSTNTIMPPEQHG
jgi:hypothetical protein